MNAAPQGWQVGSKGELRCTGVLLVCCTLPGRCLLEALREGADRQPLRLQVRSVGICSRMEKHRVMVWEKAVDGARGA